MLVHKFFRSSMTVIIIGVCLFTQTGCNSGSENTVVEPPKDFKITPVDEGAAYAEELANEMDPRR